MIPGCTLWSPSYPHSLAPSPHLNAWFFWAFWLTLTWILHPALFSRAPSSPFTIVFGVDVSAEGTTLTSQGWKRHWECFCPPLGSLPTLFSVWQEHAGDSLPFLWHVKAGLQVLGLGEGYKRHGFKALGCLGWDLVGKLMPQFSLCCWCQGHCFLPCDSALKDLTVEFH